MVDYSLGHPGTFRYMAPELFNHPSYVGDKKSDIWAFGIIMYLIHYRKFPNKNYININLSNELEKKQDNIILINNTLVKDPNKRWSINQICDFLK